MHRSLKIALLTLIFAVSSGSPGEAGEPPTFDRIVSQYERIRLALVHDGLDDVAEAARQIHGLSEELESNFSARLAGIRPEGAQDLRELLPAIRETSRQLSEAEAISEARESFGALSKALVRYRRLVENPTPAVAFCSMAQKVWLQPKGELGNPYYGQSMARCGEFVSR